MYSISLSLSLLQSPVVNSISITNGVSNDNNESLGSISVSELGELTTTIAGTSSTRVHLNSYATLRLEAVLP